VYESSGHEGMRPQFVQRLRDLARSEVQQLIALNHYNGWLTNLAKPIEEAAIEAAIPRASALGRQELAWHLARMLAMHWAMNNRADDALTLLHSQEAWVVSEAGDGVSASYRLTRSSIFAFSDQLGEAIEQGTLALQASTRAKDWANALPAASNVGLMHYWRGEYPMALDVLSQARAHRQRLYGAAGAGIKIDMHLGAVLYELGRVDEARQMLHGALAEMQTWPDSEYRRTECLLVHNHLAQMAIALGQRDEAAQVLANDASGVADRFLGRRLTLRLRWQRLFATPDAALLAELQALAARVASPFNRVLSELELTRYMPAREALLTLQALHASPPVQQRPGLQLHAAVLLSQAAKAAEQTKAAARWAQAAKALAERCAPFDMTTAEVQNVLAAALPKAKK
jgi:hypothetical protein